MEVQEAVIQLIEAIKDSPVYMEYKKQCERVDQSGELKEQIDEYRVQNYELQNSEQTEDMLDKVDEFEKKYEKFRENPLVEDFLDAEVAFCRMIQEIDMSLAEAVEFE